MLKIIDRYIIGKFLGTFFLTITLILAIAVVFDISEKIDDFLTRGASVPEIIFDYYINFMVYYGNLFSSMMVFIATIFFTSRMTANTEIVATLTGGVSYRRMMWPYFLAATLIGSINFVMSHYIIPTTNIDRINFERAYINKKTNDRYKNIHRQLRPGEILYMETFNVNSNTGYHFSYEVFEGNTLRQKITADFLRYDSIQDTWTMDNYYIRTIDKNGQESLEQGRRKDTTFNFDTKQIVPRLYTIAMMNTPQLNDFIEAERISGSESLNRYLIEKHQRTSYPFATYVLVLIGVSISSRKKRGGLGLNLALGLLICVTYIFFMQISTTFATVGSLPPLLAVWVPNIIFGALGAYLYYITPK